MSRRISLANCLILALCFAVVVGIQTRSYSNRAKQGRDQVYLNPPPEHLEYFTFGFSESLADSLWLRWIQDGDDCQIYGGSRPPQDLAKSDPQDRFMNPRHRNCDDSWSFRMLDAVTKLAPRFKMPYMAGTMTLAVLVEDYAGATVLFERGIQAYPDDWQILYRAGYHYLFDLKDIQKAGELMSRAADNGAPYWVKMLAARLYSKSGQATVALTMLEAFLKTLKDEDQREVVSQRIVDLKKELNASRPDGP